MSQKNKKNTKLAVKKKGKIINFDSEKFFRCPLKMNGSKGEVFFFSEQNDIKIF